MLMSRKRMPYMASLSSMSSRSTAAIQAISAHAQARRVVGLREVLAGLLAAPRRRRGG